MRFHEHARPGARGQLQRARSLQGLAPDGGLYVPAELAARRLAALRRRERPAGDRAARCIAPFAAGDRARAASCRRSSRDAFNFPAPLVPLTRDERLSVLELFHGPTAAFKDFGARFLAASHGARCASRQRAPLHDPGRDLGRHRRRGRRGVPSAGPASTSSVLFPKGLVSPTQERQLTCWGGNVQLFAVRGTFDDCQRLVKEAFARRRAARAHASCLRRTASTSAGCCRRRCTTPRPASRSGASTASRRHSSSPAATSAMPWPASGRASWACPSADIVLAHNANRDRAGFPRRPANGGRAPSVATLASAMDVGNPSNMERLRACFRDIDDLRARGQRRDASTTTPSARASARISIDTGRSGARIPPSAAEVYARLPAERGERAAGSWSRPRIRQNSARSSSR